MEKGRLAAPFDGIIAEILVEIGESVASGSSGTLVTRTPLFRLINMDIMIVRAPMDEVDSAKIEPGMVARVHTR